MRFFRSEDHVPRTPGSDIAVLTLDQAARLAHAWYRTKMEPTWRRHTADEAEGLFAELGFDRSFWRLR